jgi:MYXO-CTERM domain-containing protein
VLIHLADALNSEPMFALVLLGALGLRRRREAWGVLLFPLLNVLAYAPFYFDGSYPGAGARLLADSLGVEHALAAAALASWASRFSSPNKGLRFALASALCSMLLGFSLHTGRRHLLLRDRDGGRPMFEQAVTDSVLGQKPKGLLFVDTDHGFNLAHDPAQSDPAKGLVVARARYDDRDWLLWNSLGRPSSWRYQFAPWKALWMEPMVEPWTPPTPGQELRFEGEAEWPALGQQGGYAAPTYLAPGSCVSSGRALGIVRSAPTRACASVDVPLSASGAAELSVDMIADGPFEVSLRLGDTLLHEGAVDPRGWRGVRRSEPDGRYCVPLGPYAVQQSGPAHLTVCTTASWLGIDAVRVRPLGEAVR